MEIENFIPIICGARDGNRRTVGTNVREEDIQELYQKIDSVSKFRCLCLYRIMKPTRESMEKNRKRIKQRFEEINKEKREAETFWTDFRLLEETPTFFEKLSGCFKSAPILAEKVSIAECKEVGTDTYPDPPIFIAKRTE